MLQPKTLSEQLMYATVRLTIGTSAATGFFYQTNSDKKTTVVISNRHFAEQVGNLSDLDFSKESIIQKTTFTIHLSNGGNKQFTEEVVWHLHPSEDLAFFILTDILAKNPLEKEITYYIMHIPQNLIPTAQQLEELLPLEHVTMVGYPNGLYDAENNYPIFRSGTTASHPAINFNGKNQALLDMACLPGSSGSPVFILNEGAYLKKDGCLHAGKRIIFLGVENSIPTRFSPALYKKLLSSDGSDRYILENNYVIQEDINLGYYIKSSEINGFNNQFENLQI